MASAYGAFATDGVHHPEVFVTRVTDRTGRVLYEAHPAPKQVLPTDIARTVTGVLEQVVQRGTGINARIGRPAAGKTGSAENNTDAWFVGYTPELVAAVWVGEPQSTSVAMTPAAARASPCSAARSPPRVWQVFASSTLATVPASNFPAPVGDHHHDRAAVELDHDPTADARHLLGGGQAVPRRGPGARPGRLPGEDRAGTEPALPAELRDRAGPARGQPACARAGPSR